MNPLTPIAIFIGSALLFCLQPMVGRTLLPAFGGSAAVWSVCLATFQALLVGGYAYAHALSGMNARRQRRVHIAALAIAVAWAFVIAIAGLAWARANLHAGGQPAMQVLLVVLLGVGVPYLVLSAGSSLLQSWVGTKSGRAVYWLYAVSNLGSFIGLFAYPFFMEPVVPLHLQWIGWSAGLVVYLALVAGVAMQNRKVAGASSSRQGEGEQDAPPTSLDAALEAAVNGKKEEPPPLPRALNGAAWWYILPGLSSFMLVSTTNHLSMDVAPVPLLWAVLLGAFLLSYVFGFSRLGERGLPVWRVLALGALIGSGIVAQTEGGEGFLPNVSAGVAFVFFGSTFLHSWLYSMRPEGARLTRFYLGIAVGGAIGGMLVSFVAPMVFSGVWEYPVALIACALAALVFSVCAWRRQFAPRALNWFAAAAFAVALAAAAYYGRDIALDWLRATFPGGGALVSFFATLLSWGERAALVSIALGVVALALLYVAGNSWRAHNMPRLFNAATSLACVLVFMLTWAALRTQGEDVVLRQRNFYGSLRVTESKSSVAGENARVFSLTNGGTMHGLQVRYDPGREGRFADAPTSYYGPLGGGLSFSFSPKWRGAGIPEKLSLASVSQFERPQGQPMRVAVIGLGAGSMATWSRPGDDWTYYEINPLVDDVARDDRFFTFLENSNATRAPVRTVMGDARLLLEQERRDNAPKYDVLVADAYTGDSLPMQLATEEAFRLYKDRLAPDGVLVIHISNWHLDLLPLCKAVAAMLDMHAVGVLSDGSDYDMLESTLWIFLTRKQIAVDAAGSGAELVDFSKVRAIRPPTDDWGGLQSLIRFKWGGWRNPITFDTNTPVLSDSLEVGE